MTRCVTKAGLAVTVCAAVASAAFGGGDDRFLLLDRSLKATPVSVSTIGPGGARVVEGRGEATDVPLSEIVALIPEWWRPGADGAEMGWAPAPAPTRRESASPLGMLLLTDGRRLVGRYLEAGADEIGWDHPRMARSVFPLDDVRRIQLAADGGSGGGAVRGAGGAAQRDPTDRVIMTNADMVTGFVDSIGNVVKVESEGKKVQLPIKQVAVIELANPEKAPSGLRLWLGDGSVIGGKGFGEGGTAGGLRLEVGDASSKGSSHVMLSVGDVTALATDAGAVIPLASLPIESQKGVGERRYAQPASFSWRGQALAETWRARAAPGDPAPPLDAPDIDLPGPMSVEWALPAGAVRIAGWAEAPPESRLWAEFTLNIEAVNKDGTAKALASESMSGARPVVEFNIELPRPAPERVRVSIDPGSRGPIQDRVLLRRTLILVER